MCIAFRWRPTPRGFLRSKADVLDWIQTGVDVEGEIAGEEASGRGQILSGGPGSGVAEGLSVRYRGENKPVEPTGFCGNRDFHAELDEFSDWSEHGPQHSYVL